VKSKIRQYIKAWEARGYPFGIPDEAPPMLEAQNKVPSYRAICKAIMKNDVALLTLGYSREECEAYNALKRIELTERGVIRPRHKQAFLPLEIAR